MSFTRFPNRVETKPLGLHNNRGCARGLGSTGPRAFSVLIELATPSAILPYMI